MYLIIYYLIKVVILVYLNSRAYRIWCLRVFCFYYSFQENQLHTSTMVCSFNFMKLVPPQLVLSLIYSLMKSSLMQHVSLAFQ